MSSNRANAAARQRRAGGNDQQPPPIPGRGPPQNMQGRPGQQQMAPPNAPIGLPKQMTIQNAIALITIRLGRVETIVQNLDSESDGIQNQNSENGVIIDKGVFDNMVSRLDALERGHKLLSTKTTAPIVTAPIVTAPIVTAPIVTAPTIVPAIVTTANNESVTKLTESVEVIKAEIAQVKDLLLKLQSFTMETNQKLADIVFSEEPGQDQDQDQEQEMDENRIMFLQQNMSDLGSNSIMNMSVSLKDLIQKELASTDITEIIEEDA
jgi:hypothetical protein